MKRSGLWIIVTIAVGLVSIAGIVIRDLNLGVEFSGGRLLEYSTAEQLDPEDARVAVSDAGFPQAVVQASSSDGAGENISVRLGNATHVAVVAKGERHGAPGLFRERRAVRSMEFEAIEARGEVRRFAEHAVAQVRS